MGKHLKTIEKNANVRMYILVAHATLAGLDSEERERLKRVDGSSEASSGLALGEDRMCDESARDKSCLSVSCGRGASVPYAGYSQFWIPSTPYAPVDNVTGLVTTVSCPASRLGASVRVQLGLGLVPRRQRDCTLPPWLHFGPDIFELSG